jgi:DNA-binding NtrC family response regulator
MDSKLIGQSPEFQRLLHGLQMVAPTEAPVMLVGPHGSGRTRLAQELHELSPRRRGPWVSLQAALLQDLNACFDADGGTLFLADVGQLTPGLQSSLLGLLETARLDGRPLGVRLVLSADRNLVRLVEQGLFRQDLYYRLNVVPLEVPTLAERAADIPLLLKAFIKEFARVHQRRAPDFGVGTMNLLKAYAWPGNVQELRNFAERMVILLPGQRIQPENLPLEIKTKPTASPFQLPEAGVDLNELEAEILRQALTLAGGNRSKAARLLRISRDTFLYRLQKFALG